MTTSRGWYCNFNFLLKFLKNKFCTIPSSKIDNKGVRGWLTQLSIQLLIMAQVMISEL